jgi:hypothetical protein
MAAAAVAGNDGVVVGVVDDAVVVIVSIVIFVYFRIDQSSLVVWFLHAGAAWRARAIVRSNPAQKNVRMND